jgi:hypothetical protein
MTKKKEVDQETRAQLTALVVEFNWMLDRGLSDGFGDLFTGDGVFLAAGNERRGRTELDEFARGRTTGVDATTIRRYRRQLADPFSDGKRRALLRALPHSFWNAITMDTLGGQAQEHATHHGGLPQPR